jgi:hypothetical protein
MLQNFGGRLISKELLSKRFPILTPQDVFVWGPQKGMVYTNKNCIKDLTEDIRQQKAVITADMLQWIFASLEHRVQLCMDAGGKHFQRPM